MFRNRGGRALLTELVIMFAVDGKLLPVDQAI
jgi:hypothetical protein